ncbi:MAG: hypothetical protein IT316_09720 [Anaerolineales bacterium]|nr:hypothetical protein [Anaerolineales bacterium]
MWAPYDASTYQAVLDELDSDDVALEIGAGDLRLARKMALVCRKVYAIERQPAILSLDPRPLPGNLIAVQGDARDLPFPAGITAGVLLMRHCNHFHLYIEKLKAAGCRRLITNARWRMGVETIQLEAPRRAYGAIPIGWYACWCGATGFVDGDIGLLNPEAEATIHEVAGCPRCQDVFKRGVI